MRVIFQTESTRPFGKGEIIAKRTKICFKNGATIDFLEDGRKWDIVEGMTVLKTDGITISTEEFKTLKESLKELIQKYNPEVVLLTNHKYFVQIIKDSKKCEISDLGLGYVEPKYLLYYARIGSENAYFLIAID